MYSTQSKPASLTVSELTRDAKTLLESHFDWVSVEGEIGDFTSASSGHWYFTLKDSRSQVRCAMFKRANARVKIRPTRGDLVQIRARVSLYEARGEFQLICEHLAPAGDGALQLAFEQLKQKLADEGLFAPERKMAIPSDATRIGVVTSATGAAIHDILSVLARRSPRSHILLYPVPVQGDEAAPQIAAAIDRANRMNRNGIHPLDVLIVGRGGGSLEDLWPFNEEMVARAIAASDLPIISAVGHEVDFSIADFVADYRAPTPSAAAEVVTTDQREWLQRFDGVAIQLQRQMTRRLQSQATQLNQLRRRLRSPQLLLRQRHAQWQTLTQALQRAMQRTLLREKQSLTNWQQRLGRSQPQRQLSAQQQLLQTLRERLEQSMQRQLHQHRDRIANHTRLLTTLGPQNTLNRGYAIVTNVTGRVVNRYDEVTPGQPITIKLATGRLAATTNQALED